MGIKTTSAKKNMPNEQDHASPILKTVEHMSRLSGIGENKLRDLMDSGDLEYIKIGNRRLLTEEAIWKWYNQYKIIERAHLNSALSQQLPAL